MKIKVTMYSAATLLPSGWRVSPFQSAGTYRGHRERERRWGEAVCAEEAQLLFSQHIMSIPEITTLVDEMLSKFLHLLPKEERGRDFQLTKLQKHFPSVVLAHH